MVELLAIAVAGLIGIAGTALGQWLQTKARGHEKAEDLRRLNWEGKRESYERLAQAVDRVNSAAAGALASGTTVKGEVGPELVAAAMVVELHASPDVWQTIKPAVQAVSLRANALVPSVSAVAAERLRELGANEEEGWERLRSQMVAAMRDDLQQDAGNRPRRWSLRHPEER